MKECIYREDCCDMCRRCANSYFRPAYDYWTVTYPCPTTGSDLTLTLDNSDTSDPFNNESYFEDVMVRP